MKKYLMKIKVNMIVVILLSLVAGMAGNYFFNNRWREGELACQKGLEHACRKHTAHTAAFENKSDVI